MKTKLQSVLFALLGSIGTALLLTTGTTAALVADEATIDKSSVVVTTQRHTVYFGNGKGAGDFTTWSWTPRIEFRVNGPITSGSQLQVEYTLPGNKSWLKINCTIAIAALHPGSKSTFGFESSAQPRNP